MPLDVANFMHLASACAGSVAPATLLAVAQVESGLDPLAIGVNHGPPLSRPPRSRDEAIAVAKRLLVAGANVDLGLLQINAANLQPLGLSVEDAFETCQNLAAGATLSLYNSGDAARGFRNGYVARVVSAAAHAPPPVERPRAALPVQPPTPAWDAFGDLTAARLVATFSPSKQGTAP
jgi:type IV secretion system protein VirB1